MAFLDTYQVASSPYIATAKFFFLNRPKKLKQINFIYLKKGGKGKGKGGSTKVDKKS